MSRRWRALSRRVLMPSSGENMAKSRQRPNAIANDLGGRQNWRRKNRARDAPQPEPEHEREDNENRIERESSGEEHRRRRLSLHHVDDDIERRREQGLPGRGDRE